MLLRIPSIPVDEVAPVALQNIDIIDIQSFQAFLDSCEDVLEQGSAGTYRSSSKGWHTLRESP